MTGGATAAGGTYQRAHVTAAGFDTNSGETVDAGGAVGVQGRAASGVIRDQARAVGAATAGLGGSPAGARLIMATMDQHLEAMQRQLDQTTAQNRLLALRLRQLAAGYRGMGSPGVGGMPLSGLGGLMGGAGGGGGGLSGLSGLASLPASLVGHGMGGRRSAQWSAAEPSGREALGAAGVDRGAIPLSEVSFEGKGVWASGRGAMRRYLEEALDRMGITDPRARANWMEGMTTIADHESSYRANAINLSDTNAHGARQVDGGPLHATRGPWQVMPDTFARYHQRGTSNHIWDPVANACASMNYQMARYGVAHDGHNQKAKVGQANWNIHHGY
ncbi:transglycosylase SLT domain-containing protein [Mycobacterium intracellulare]|uniref:Transglycosylase n=2 Tax=Mycobacterium intracellulare TaxID=1767 RepID=A0A7U5MR25_MYCIT|nr:transglycosylase SLT domain-containing protein [Mycobacterium intracellulare]ASL18149.1 transglycosylase [Mycobacterium intracellulare subsp. chimaera]